MPLTHSISRSSFVVDVTKITPALARALNTMFILTGGVYSYVSGSTAHTNTYSQNNVLIFASNNMNYLYERFLLGRVDVPIKNSVIFYIYEENVDHKRSLEELRKYCELLFDAKIKIRRTWL